MSSASRLGRQIQEVLASLGNVGASSALIDGLALAPNKVVRATQDVDLLTRSADADAIHAELERIGHSCTYRSEDAANYLCGDERVDLLYARRPIAQQLLANAESRDTSFGTVRVVSLEGLVAFKLQGYVNDPRRTQDLEDIRAMLRANRDIVDRAELREYFRLFDGEHCWMNSSTLSAELRRMGRATPHLAAEGGLAMEPRHEREPFAALEDLMVVVEALCPEWPARGTFGPMPDMRL